MTDVRFAKGSGSMPANAKRCETLMQRSRSILAMQKQARKPISSTITAAPDATVQWCEWSIGTRRISGTRNAAPAAGHSLMQASSLTLLSTRSPIYSNAGRHQSETDSALSMSSVANWRHYHVVFGLQERDEIDQFLDGHVPVVNVHIGFAVN